MVETKETILSPRSTSFHQAIAEGSVEIVEKLLNEEGCQQSFHHGSFPLHLACKSGHIAMVRMLLDHTYKEFTKKYEVEVDVVKEGIDKNITVDVLDHTGGTPLYLACTHGHIDIAKFLLDEGADIDAVIHSSQHDMYQAMNSLQMASQQGHHALVQLLLDHEADREVTNGYGMHSLHLAAANGHIEVIRILLSHGTDVNIQSDDGSTALHFSCIYGHTETVWFLLQYDGIDLDIGYPQNLTNHRHEDDDGEDDQPGDGQTPLHLATQAGHLDVVRLLLTHGFVGKLEQPDVYGFTCLHTACEGGHVTIAALIVDKGGSISAKDNDGRTPLHHACTRGHVEVVELLLQRGADVHIPSESQITPLMRAAGGGHVSVVQMLLAQGAQVNSRNELGKTPLHWAVEPPAMFAENKGMEQMEMLVRVLLSAGAKARIRDLTVSKYRPSDVLINSGMIGGDKVLELLLIAEEEEEEKIGQDREEDSDDEDEEVEEEEENNNEKDDDR